MSQNELITWKINGLELELDISDADVSEKYEKAFKQMEAEEKALKKDGPGHEYIRNYCLLFYNLYDRIFGEGTAKKIFDGKMNSRVND